MKKLIYTIIIGSVVAIVYYSGMGGASDEDYTQSIKEVRKSRIQFLENSDQSPFNLSNLPFEEPTYFPIDPKYKVNARLERISSPQRVNVKNSDGTSETYVKYAYAQFKIDGATHRLLILKPASFGSINKYFTAFADETSGDTTYGGGRYLDLEIGKSDRVTIDFNLAYNPYCAYAASYSCPLPPAENILPIAIKAGELDFSHAYNR